MHVPTQTSMHTHTFRSIPEDKVDVPEDELIYCEGAPPLLLRVQCELVTTHNPHNVT